MIKKTITIGLDSGLEARPVAMLVQIASQYESTVYVEGKSGRVNAKSIMGMMTLGKGSGEDITLAVEGPDEEAALNKLESYLKKED